MVISTAAIRRKRRDQLNATASSVLYDAQMMGEIPRPMPTRDMKTDIDGWRWGRWRVVKKERGHDRAAGSDNGW